MMCHYAIYEHNPRAIVFITFAPKKVGEKYFQINVWIDIPKYFTPKHAH